LELFKNPADAVTFAMRFSSQQYAQSELAKLMKQAGRGASSSGKGLVALDGAAQAGFILARLERIEPLKRACIIARYSSRTEDCPCCGNQKPLDEYRDAIDALADWSLQFLGNGMSVRKVRYAVIQEFFERRRSIGKVAEEIGVARRTAYDQKAKIWPPLTDLDKGAQQAVNDVLIDICGELEQ
jgi:hypothetical protein